MSSSVSSEDLWERSRRLRREGRSLGIKTACERDLALCMSSSGLLCGEEGSNCSPHAAIFPKDQKRQGGSYNVHLGPERQTVLLHIQISAVCTGYLTNTTF